MEYNVINHNCLNVLREKSIHQTIDLTFLDPPFNQNKEYAYHDDNMSEAAYWDMMTEVCQATFDLTAQGGAIYFMQREKNTEHVLSCLRKTGWCLQNLIIWKKKTSAVPVASKYGKHYQIIKFGEVHPPLPPQKRTHPTDKLDYSISKFSKLLNVLNLSFL